MTKKKLKQQGMLGIHAIIQKWLENGCQESATEMVEILNNEYKGKSLEN